MPESPTDTTGPDSTAGPASARSGPAIPGEPTAGHWPRFESLDLDRAQAGDSEALGRFFDHYFGPLYSVILRFVGHREIAEDITQGVFLKIRRHISRLDTRRDPAPWLYTVAVNACRDHQRSAWWRAGRRSVPIESALDVSELIDDAGNPERAFEATRDARRVQIAISKLPADLRMSVILHDFEGLPQEKIAQVTGITHVAARKRHSRALRSLALLLAEEAPS